MALTACGTSEPTLTAPSADPETYTGVFLVQEGPDHGPRLCHDGVTVMVGVPESGGGSQSGGPDVHGWSWDEAGARSPATASSKAPTGSPAPGTAQR